MGLIAIWTATPKVNSSLIIVDIFAGSVLGGLGSIYGAIIGGLIVGASETYLAVWLERIVQRNLYGASVGSQVLDFQKGIPLAIMIVVLLVAPQGLTGVNWQRVGKRLGLFSRCQFIPSFNVSCGSTHIDLVSVFIQCRDNLLSLLIVSLTVNLEFGYTGIPNFGKFYLLQPEG